MDFNKFIGKTVFVSGTSKNSGKTTFLNYLSNKMRDKTEFCRLTIGIDGEITDSVFGNIKPRVFVEKNDFIVTTEHEIHKSGGDFCIYEVFPYKTVEGRLVFARAGRRARISLIGPETNDYLGNIIKIVKKHVNTIFVDGAGDRVTQISSVENSVFFYIFFIENNSLNKSIEKIFQINDYSEVSDEYKNILYKKIKGIITLNKISNIEKDIKNIVFEDMTKIFLDFAQWKKIRKKYNIFFENKLELAGIVVNSKMIETDLIKKLLNKKVNLDYIIFNPYKHIV
ncbi:MAG: hypothetical protein M0R46_04420 [Candidatus Muirbacterium halophilum]|nr:hypothetical protein [Candidatus Muirbacterium halophilum]MCK9475139.1 hypothetical protein [Candidatus Muirbacterium halophilum]